MIVKGSVYHLTHRSVTRQITARKHITELSQRDRLLSLLRSRTKRGRGVLLKRGECNTTTPPARCLPGQLPMTITPRYPKEDQVAACLHRASPFSPHWDTQARQMRPLDTYLQNACRQGSLGKKTQRADRLAICSSMLRSDLDGRRLRAHNLRSAEAFHATK